MHILINKNYLTYKNYKVKCCIGKRGIGNKRKEGDLITPKGNLKLNIFYTEKIELKEFNLKLKKLLLKKIWAGVMIPIKDYNKLIKIPSEYSYEKLYKKENVYDIILVLNYNMNPVLKIKVVQYLFMLRKKIIKKLKDV